MNAPTNEPLVRQTPLEIVLERTFEAPRARVWEAFSQAEHLAAWWGPSGFTTTTQKFDFRAGGEWRFTMHGPDGADYLNHVVYLEVVPPERLVYQHAGEGHTEAVDFRVEVALIERAPSLTQVRFAMTFRSPEIKEMVVTRYGAVEGAVQTLGRLAEHLKQKDAENTESVFTLRRVVPAVPERVWEVWTQPDHLMHWFSPKVWRLSTCEIDLRDGGSFFYCMSSERTPDMWGLWKLREVRPVDRLSFVASFSDAERRVVRAPFSPDWPLEVASIVTFEPHAGVGRGTLLTVRSEPVGASESERATFMRGFASMEQGWGQTLASLAEYLRAK